MNYTYEAFQKLKRNYKRRGTSFLVFFVICITSAAWIPIFYTPMQNVNIGSNISMKDVTIVVDSKKYGKISNKEFFQTINIVVRNQVAETVPVILIIQDEKVLATYILEDRNKIEIKTTFRTISDKPIQFYFYQPPPMVAQKIKETGDFRSLTEYYVNQAAMDYRAY